MKVVYCIFLSVLIPLSALQAQEAINQLDANGKRHGVWKKYYPGTKQLRYEGAFDHGKEVGVFKYYCSECGEAPALVKTFNKDNDLADVQYFTIKGKLVSEGKMRGKNRMGEWVYYHKKGNSVMTREQYENGKLQGVKTTYYPDGQVTEELHFEKGLMQGDNLYYSPEGVLLKKLQYTNDQLHGPAEYYDAQGNVVIRGQYKAGKKDGIWRYYQNGQVTKEETFPKPRKKRTNE